MGKIVSKKIQVEETKQSFKENLNRQDQIIEKNEVGDISDQDSAGSTMEFSAEVNPFEYLLDKENGANI